MRDVCLKYSMKLKSVRDGRVEEERGEGRAKVHDAGRSLADATYVSV